MSDQRTDISDIMQDFNSTVKTYNFNCSLRSKDPMVDDKFTQVAEETTAA